MVLGWPGLSWTVRMASGLRTSPVVLQRWSVSSEADSQVPGAGGWPRGSLTPVLWVCLGRARVELPGQDPFVWQETKEKCAGQRPRAWAAEMAEQWGGGQRAVGRSDPSSPRRGSTPGRGSIMGSRRTGPGPVTVCVRVEEASRGTLSLF